MKSTLQGTGQETSKVDGIEKTGMILEVPDPG